MRLVLDTNVLVSALLHPGRTPDLALTAVRARGDVVLYDERLMREYRDVLGRKKFAAIDPMRTAALLRVIEETGVIVVESVVYNGAMIDEGDRMFVEVALAGRADALITGNVKHYVGGLGFEVLAPAAWLARFGPTAS